jgi:hypothetical protein
LSAPSTSSRQGSHFSGAKLKRASRPQCAAAIGVLFILPMIGAQIGLDFNIVSHVIAVVTNEVVAVILRLTGYS